MNINFEKPFFIAEISCNHMNNYDILEKTASAAFAAGASAVKLQTSTPDTLTRKFNSEEFYVREKGSPWDGVHLYDLYERTCTPLEWPLKLIRKYSDKEKVIFSTPFSPEMVDLLESKASPRLYKISAIDWNYVDLIKKCCETGKPVLMSFVKPSVQLPKIKALGFSNIIPMLCISKYPALSSHMNFSELEYLKTNEIFGFSDHSLNSSLSALAIAHGATVIEKHFKLNNSIVSEDAHFSIDPQNFASQVKEFDEIYTAMNAKGSDVTIPVGRSIYIDKDLQVGDVLDKDSLCIIRPGGGLDSFELEKVLYRRVNKIKRRGDRLDLDDFEPT